MLDADARAEAEEAEEAEAWSESCVSSSPEGTFRSLRSCMLAAVESLPPPIGLSGPRM